jgi:hypothetical protein
VWSDEFQLISCCLGILLQTPPTARLGILVSSSDSLTSLASLECLSVPSETSNRMHQSILNLRCGSAFWLKDGVLILAFTLPQTSKRESEYFPSIFFQTSLYQTESGIKQGSIIQTRLVEIQLLEDGLVARTRTSALSTGSGLNCTTSHITSPITIQ